MVAPRKPAVDPFRTFPCGRSGGLDQPSRLPVGSQRCTVFLNVLSLHRFCLPDYQFVKPDLGRSDNLVIQRPHKPVERGIIKGLEDPVAVLDSQVLQHCEGFLPLLDDWQERYHDLRQRRL
jgi:hypothetical protein